MRACFHLLCVPCAVACSLMQPDGVGIERIDQTYSEGSIGPDRVRLELVDYGKGGVAKRTRQAIFDFGTGSLEPHSDSMEWMPAVLPFASYDAGGTFAGGVANVSWPSGGVRVLCALPNATSAMWFFSATLDRMLFVYSTGGGYGEHRLAACSADGMCVHGPAPSTLGVLDPSSSSIEVWDDQGLVGLPLLCCVCISHAYYTFPLQLSATEAPTLTPVGPLNTIGPSWIDAVTGEVWGAGGGYTGHADSLTVTRYNYRTHTTASMELTSEELDRFFDDGESGALSARVIVLIVAVAVVALAGALLALFKCQGKQCSQPAPQTPPPKGETSATLEPLP